MRLAQNELRTDQSGMKTVAHNKTKRSRVLSSAVIGLAMTLVMSTGAIASPDQIASLETKISNTSAINFIAKLKIKNDIDSLTEEIGQIHNGQSDISLRELKLRFEDFFHSTVVMIRKGDPSLAKELVMLREELWKILTIPEAEAPRPTAPQAKAVSADPSILTPLISASHGMMP